MSLWTFDAVARRYRVTDEGAVALGQRSGTFVGDAKMLQLRDGYIALRKDATNTLAQQVANKTINAQQWTLAMRQEIKTNMINQYMLAHGGRNSMTPADWGRVGQMCKQQYDFLDRFASDVAAGRYTEQQIAARARMYVEASAQAFERGKVLARGMPDLPVYPSDGGTACLSNCKCSWTIREFDDRWECRWSLADAEHCAGCVERAARFSPLVVQRSAA